jgi:hypothetical protein
MPRRCPPGVLCIENVTIMFIGVIFLILGGSVYFYTRKNGTAYNNGRAYNNGTAHHQINDTVRNTIIFKDRHEQKGYGDDVFYDLYKAPLRDDRCLTTSGDIRGAVPINVSTQSCADAQYRQLGILTRYGGKDETILPLMGRPLFSKRDKWNFYTLNDKNNMIKLPVKVKGKSGTSEYGCDNVYSGDIVFVEGYNDAFKVTTYDNDVVRYLPSL